MKIQILSLRKELIKMLGSFGIEAAVFESDYIIEHFAGFTKLQMLTERSLAVSEDVYDKIIKAASERSNGKPLQHIIGHAEFMGLKFKVNENVLIPRPDTEILVQEAIVCSNKISELKNKNYTVKILDMCTGSGCIAISLKHYLPEADIHASDISEKALDTARENAINSNETSYDISFYCGNYFEPFTSNNSDNADLKFDIIVSNPPYIPTGDIEELEDEVKLHDPFLALDGGKDGFTAYREIISKAPLYINKGGCLLLEAGINQAKDIADLMKNNFCDIKIIRDYGGIERVVYGKLN